MEEVWRKEAAAREAFPAEPGKIPSLDNEAGERRPLNFNVNQQLVTHARTVRGGGASRGRLQQNHSWERL